MFKVVRVLCFSSVATILMFFTAIITATTTNPMAKPGCPTMCGNVSIPYPYGIGPGAACSLSRFYNITCNSSYDPPRPFIAGGNLEIIDINISGQIRIKNLLASKYYLKGKIYSSYKAKIDLRSFPLIFSDVSNKFTVVGCDERALITGFTRDNRRFATGCTAWCTRLRDVINGSCSGIGCCQTSVPNGLRNFTITVKSYHNHSYVSNFSQYGYAFLLGEQAGTSFNFTVTDLVDPGFEDKATNEFPIVIDWFVGQNLTCKQAQEESSTYACHSNNTKCENFYNGYRCSCLPGYQGNPYLTPGCTDIDECTGPNNHCSHICNNIPGDYQCSCPKGHRGDGLENGSRCTSDASHLVLKLSLGFSIGSGLIVLVLCCYWLYRFIKRRKEVKKKAKYFKKNGGLLLQQQISSIEGVVETTKVFSEKELEKATDDFNENRILGQGGQGTVYKGMLVDGRIVAIKKSRKVDERQLEQFINEVVILSQINHRNVVKLLGCCLEAEVPLLVYEFIPNGTLYQHIHNGDEDFHVSWKMRLQIAAESASALFYLHSSSSAPIYHRDIKSSNILLDEKYRTKISDFGTSRAISIEQTHVTTCVLGTYGYLDPEYFQSNQFTEKSDVYSFGVVLVELLSGKKPICPNKDGGWISLAVEFLSYMETSRLSDILDARVVDEGKEEEFLAVANLAKQCLDMKGKQRPTMKEVSVLLDGIRSQQQTTISKELITSENGHVITEMVNTESSPCSVGIFSSDDSPYGSIEVQPFMANI